MKNGFSLIEILIVVSILGIISAVVIPVYQDQSGKARESAARDNLRLLRDAIERYALEHNDVPPGYRNNNPDSMAHENYFEHQLCDEGNYLNEIPENPFNNDDSVQIITEEFPGASEEYGWMYKPSTREIRIDKKGTDSAGTPFSEY